MHLVLHDVFPLGDSIHSEKSTRKNLDIHIFYIVIIINSELNLGTVSQILRPLVRPRCWLKSKGQGKMCD